MCSYVSQLLNISFTTIKETGINDVFTCTHVLSPLVGVWLVFWLHMNYTTGQIWPKVLSLDFWQNTSQCLLTSEKTRKFKKKIKYAFTGHKMLKRETLFLSYSRVCVGMCQSPHTLTAGDYYSLFQLTAGLSPTTGEHAGKWVTVNTVCLPHICSSSTSSTPKEMHDTSTKN